LKNGTGFSGSWLRRSMHEVHNPATELFEGRIVADIVASAARTAQIE